MDYDYAQSLGISGQTSRFNTPGILLANAAILAGGASHLELGDGVGGNPGLDMLDNEYFPNEDLTPSSSLLNMLETYYDFDVEYENLLRGGLRNNNNAISLSGIASGSSASPNTVWAFPRDNGNGLHMLNLINLIGETNIDWRDDSANYPVPTPQENITVEYYYGNGEVAGVSWASPVHDWAGRRRCICFVYFAVTRLLGYGLYRNQPHFANRRGASSQLNMLTWDMTGITLLI
jgi:dextranase